MASPLDSMRGLLKKQDVILMALCALLAVGFLALAASNVSLSANFLTIDNLFFTTVCMLLALVFLSIPALYLKERGVLANPFAVGGEIPPARVAEHVHFEGSTKLFLAVLAGLLVLTLVEVVLAYIHLNLVLMLVILMGLSVIKAALIMAYFMHLKFERLSLVLTLVPILVVCICLLLVFFPDSRRAHDLRSTKGTATAPEPGAEH
ncbi:MAG TPA: cytochrome C oxidase subunit IV family protein [Pyrinomonadaceae bacterium]|nr:cytochrome C oxidase subunit IV family protein [Pyrinomonadaceae bacterium]